MSLSINMMSPLTISATNDVQRLACAGFVDHLVDLKQDVSGSYLAQDEDNVVAPAHVATTVDMDGDCAPLAAASEKMGAGTSNKSHQTESAATNASSAIDLDSPLPANRLP